MEETGGERCQTQEEVRGSGRGAERQPGWAWMPRWGRVGRGKMTVGAGMTWHSLDSHHVTPSSVNTMMDEGHQAYPGTLTLHPCCIPPISPSPALSCGQRAPYRTGEDWTPRGVDMTPKVSQLSCQSQDVYQTYLRLDPHSLNPRLPTGPVARARPSVTLELTATSILR